MGVTLETRTGPLVKVQATNDTTAGTAVADPADVLIDPLVAAATDATILGLVDLGRGGAISPNGLKLVPFGVGNAATTFLMAVYAIERLLTKVSTEANQWTYVLRAAFTCTLCTKTGVTGGVVPATAKYCDTIALITNCGNANVSCEIVTPGTNRAAHVVVDTKGAEAARVLFWMNGSATSANALLGKL